MTAFHRIGESLYCEQVSLADVAEAHGTPVYVYSRAAIEQTFRAYQAALRDQQSLICYAVKANSNLAVLKVLADLGAGFDIVSVGELERVIQAGGDPGKTVFSGVCKSPREMSRALELGICCFNVESEAELATLSQVASEQGVPAPVSLRVNPDVDAKTHPYIATGLKDNKFGIELTRARELYQKAQEMPGLEVIGIDCHIGSQLLDTAPLLEALDHLLALLDQLEKDGLRIRHLDMGGGLGVAYGAEQAPAIDRYLRSLVEGIGEREVTLVLEPGRSIVANAGALLTSVQYLKPTSEKNFALVDAAMNDLLRPALYGAWQDIVPVQARPGPLQCWDIVGPVCETGDFLGKSRELCLASGDLLAVLGAGAYGFVMSSNYNSRPRPAEVMVDGAAVHTVRQRETLTDLWALETVLPD